METIPQSLLIKEIQLSLILTHLVILFYIKTEFSRGGGDQVNTGILSGNPGTQNGTLSWNTKGVSRGKYYYVCSPHAPFGMGGSIIIE